MATYNINDLTVRNGRLYTGNVEVGARDTVSSYNPAEPTPEGFTTTFGATAPQQTLYSQLPAWALNSDRANQFLPSAPQAPEGYAAWLNGAYPDPTATARSTLSGLSGIGDYYSSQVDPVAEFANTGSNRDALYGAYMRGGNSLNTQEAPSIQNAFGNAGGSFSSGLFDRNSPIPNLATSWSGEEYTPSLDWVAPVSAQSSKDAQAILKKLYPNISQADMDKAAYAAYQKGDKYYSGTGAPSNNDSNGYYYGHGPLPVVTAIAKQLGMTPQVEQFINQNWSQFANQYGEARKSAKASEKAEDQASVMEGIKGVTGVLGGAFGLSSLLSGGLGSFLGGSNIMGPAMETGAMGTTGGTSMFEGLGDWFSNLTGGDTFSIEDYLSNGGAEFFGGPEALGEAGGYDFLSSEALGDLTQFADQNIVDLFNRAGTRGFDQYGNPATGLDWLKSQFGGPGSSTSTMTSALKSLLGGSADSPLGGALSALGKLYYTNKQSQAGQSALNKTQQRTPSFMGGLTPIGALGRGVSRLPTIGRPSTRTFAEGGSVILPPSSARRFAKPGMMPPLSPFGNQIAARPQVGGMMSSPPPAGGMLASLPSTNSLMAPFPTANGMMPPTPPLGNPMASLPPAGGMLPSLFSPARRFANRATMFPRPQAGGMMASLPQAGGMMASLPSGMKGAVSRPGFAGGGYAEGGTGGQADKIPAMLSDGEYVLDAQTVADLGDGNNAAGAGALDQMRINLRKHKRSGSVKSIPPKAKRPAQYLKGAK